MIFVIKFSRLLLHWGLCYTMWGHDGSIYWHSSFCLLLHITLKHILRIYHTWGFNSSSGKQTSDLNSSERSCATVEHFNNTLHWHCRCSSLQKRHIFLYGIISNWFQTLRLHITYILSFMIYLTMLSPLYNSYNRMTTND
jgi:hypothetical protein